MNGDSSRTDALSHAVSANGAPAGEHVIPDERRLVLAAFSQFERIAARAAAPVAGFSAPGYRILREIHRGGQGVVYQAIQESTQRKMALKVLKQGPFADRTELTRFEREVDVLSRLNYPNIVAIHDRGVSAGHAYYVMDYVVGKPLDAYVAGADLSVDEVLRLLGTVCDAVNVAHLRGVIHRDLKPANILVVEEESGVSRRESRRTLQSESEIGTPKSAIPKILDFGLAKLAAGTGIRPGGTGIPSGSNGGRDPGHDTAASRAGGILGPAGVTGTPSADRSRVGSAMTVSGQFVGSLPWSSPEQAAGQSELLDIRTDVYSLGVILYQLLVGRFPYPVAGRIDDVVRHILHTAPARPSEWADAPARLAHSSRLARGRLDPDLDHILLKCLAKAPDERYQSAAELARDIRHHLAHEPIEAAPPRAGYRIRKFVRRNRAMVFAVAGIAAALVLGVVGTTLGLIWAVREQRQAEAQRVIAQSEAARAKREADQARAVNEFMREVLTSVEPANRGADVRLIEVLAGASAAAAQRFAGHPLQEAQVRELLAETYDNLSKWPEAKAEFQRALALWQQHAGPDDPRALVAESRCAGAAVKMEQTREAEQTLVGLLPRMERVLGTDDRRTLETRRALAYALALRGREDEAEAMLHELRGHPRLADDDEMQVRILHHLIRINRRRAGTNDRARDLAALAQTEPLAREWVERCLQLYGPDSAVTMHAQVELSIIVCRQGQPHVAADMCRDVLARSAARFGECHDVRVQAMTELAEALGRMGEAHEPAKLYLRKIECMREYMPAGSLPLLGSISDALKYIDRAGRAAEGELLARELTDAMRKFGGSHGDLAFDSELYVARFVSQQGRLDEAEPIFESLLGRAEGAERNVRARLHLFYGSHLTHRQSFEEAERQLMTAAELTGDVRRGTWQTFPDDILIELIALHDACGRPERADEYRRRQAEVLATALAERSAN